jgi:hypothetical protein
VRFTRLRCVMSNVSGTNLDVRRYATMRNAVSGEDLAKPLFKFDSDVRDVFIPYRQSLPVKLVSWLSDVGDQPQLRILSGGTMAVGLVRRDVRMMRAGARMLIAHEAATFLKNVVKDEV